MECSVKFVEHKKNLDKSISIFSLGVNYLIGLKSLEIVW